MAVRSAKLRVIYFSMFVILLFYVLYRYDPSNQGSVEPLTLWWKPRPYSDFHNSTTPESVSSKKVVSQNATQHSVDSTILPPSPVLPKNLTVKDFTVKYLRPKQNASQDGHHIGYPHQICNCGKYKPPNRGEYQRNLSGVSSTCSHEATEYGTGQKVRSYALFVHEDEDLPRYVLPIEANMDAHSEIFPGWITRIYSNISTVNPFVCGLVCKYDTLFWCDINNIPEMGDLGEMHGRTWRFLPLGDPTVDIVLSRDMDNTVFARERAAVAEWEASDLPFHGMRDNPGMGVVMLAGLWGAKNYLLGPLFSKFLQQTLIKAARHNQLEETWDETILKQYIHEPYHRLLFLVHDSYFCTKFDDFKTLPFPTQRIEDQTVGEHYIKNVTKYTYNVPPCPVACRPAYGKHWVYC